MTSLVMIKNKVFLLLSLFVLFCSCKKAKNDVFSFDEAAYYHSKTYKLPKPPDPHGSDFKDYEFYHADL